MEQNRIDPVLGNDWYVVARSQDLPPNTVMAIRLFSTDLVLWRGTHTSVLAWEDRCPHRSIRLSGGTVQGDRLVCPYHGLAFNPEGRCVHVPAHPDYSPPKQACVPTYPTQEHHGLIYVSLGEPPQAPPLLPEWTDPTYRSCLSGPYRCQSNGFRAIENFLDVSHFPFVHPGTLGDLSQPTVGEYEVVTTEQGIWLKDIRVWQPDPDGQGTGAIVTYNYWALRPLTAYLQKETAEGNRLAILFYVTPVDEEEFVGWMWIAMNYAHDVSDEEKRNFQDHLILEDFQRLTAHNPKRLPLYNQTEFHLPCDRGSLAYRKWLKSLGVTYGTQGKEVAQWQTETVASNRGHWFH